jgi:hypothetical protein
VSGPEGWPQDEQNRALEESCAPQDEQNMRGLDFITGQALLRLFAVRRQ